MKIRTQFRINLAFFAVLLVLIAASMLITNQQVKTVTDQKNIADRVAQSAYDLSYLSNDYVIYQESQLRSRWETKYASFCDDVACLSMDKPEYQLLLQNIKVYQQSLKDVFYDIASTVESSPQNQSIENIQDAWTRITIQTQGLISDASSLSQQLHNEVDQLNQTNIILILIMISTFGAFLISIYVQTFRRTLKSVARLQEGTAVIGSGNLDYQIQESKNDEVGELSQAFNKMAANLKTVTASKQDLEKEIIERKKAEEELRNAEEISRRRAEELEQTQKQLREKASEVEAYACRMEALAEERAKKLKEAERFAAIGQTAGMVGHDIRNPLQSILSEIYLAKSEVDALRQKDLKHNLSENISNIENDICYINKIVSDLQDFARTQKPQMEEVDISQVINDAQSDVVIPENIQTSISIEQGFPKFKADPSMLKRILTNLIQNAVQAMPKGGEIEVTATTKNNQVLILVEDTGEGIPESVRDKIFTPLFTTKSKGQGFGLAVVKRMTEAMEGNVSFTSKVGKGTKFTLNLPLTQNVPEQNEKTINLKATHSPLGANDYVSGKNYHTLP